MTVLDDDYSEPNLEADLGFSQCRNFDLTIVFVETEFLFENVVKNDFFKKFFIPIADAASGIFQKFFVRVYL